MDKRVARTRIGTVMILAGVLVILAAGGLYLHIRMEERQAGESAAEVTDRSPSRARQPGGNRRSGGRDHPGGRGHRRH